MFPAKKTFEDIVMMTRNDFELLACALKSAHNDITPTNGAFSECKQEGFALAVHAVSDVCKANNSRFDPKRFKEACGSASYIK